MNRETLQRLSLEILRLGRTAREDLENTEQEITVVERETEMRKLSTMKWKQGLKRIKEKIVDVENSQRRSNVDIIGPPPKENQNNVKENI